MRFYRQLSRYSSAFALCADMAVLTLAGALKRKEMLSPRFGDILCQLYLLSAALKRWHDEGRQPVDFAALECCMMSGFKTKLIEVDDFAPLALSPIYKKPADVHHFFGELAEQRAAS